MNQRHDMCLVCSYDHPYYIVLCLLVNNKAEIYVFIILSRIIQVCECVQVQHSLNWIRLSYMCKYNLDIYVHKLEKKGEKVLSFSTFTEIKCIFDLILIKLSLNYVIYVQMFLI